MAKWILRILSIYSYVKILTPVVALPLPWGSSTPPDDAFTQALAYFVIWCLRRILKNISNFSIISNYLPF